MFGHPMVPSQEKTTCGFYVLMVGVFGHGKYEAVSRQGNGDIFWLPSSRGGCLSIPVQGRKNGLEPRKVEIQLTGNFILGCNTLMDSRAV